ncbi:hypothetical protein [Tsukamurella tyrosinosolvens]|uniref:hypothetical protein n=1 Tax=Tsukamurella tyrosinosolvens TaxID=57704 RepID=UPI002DD43064|nr:hypothetical protein [Tsukamurella tyrosinosolvens]MEC4614610.1 hypothetical protein [Tsukamurella tyrosinosolvens]
MTTMTYRDTLDRLTRLGFGPEVGYGEHESAYRAAVRGATDAQIAAHVERARVVRDLIHPEVIDSAGTVHYAEVEAGGVILNLYSGGEVALTHDGPVDVAALMGGLRTVDDVRAVLANDGALPWGGADRV